MKFETSAGGIVYRNVRDKVEWLVTQHSQHRGWVFPKGLVGDTKVGESNEDSALREVEEEGGVKAKIIAPLQKPVEYFYKLEGNLVKKRVYYFLMEYISGDPADHDWEMMDAKFVNEDDVRKTLSFAADKKAFEEALRIFDK